MRIATQYGRYRMEVATGGYVVFDVQPTNSRHRHTYYEACLALAGSGRYHYGNRIYDIVPGHVFIAEPNVFHEITSFENHDLRLYFVSFTLRDGGGAPSGDEDAAIGAFLQGHLPVARSERPLDAYLPLLADHGSSTRLMAAEQALKLFCLEMLDVVTVAPPSGRPLPKPDTDVREALEYIDRRLDNPIRVEEIAERLGISSRSLRRRFRMATGRGIVETINQRRMERAAHRLLMGYSVGEAGKSVGIKDPAQFTRAFLRAFGMPPKRYQADYVPGIADQTTEFVLRSDETDVIESADTEIRAFTRRPNPAS